MPAPSIFKVFAARPEHVVALSFGAGLSPVWPGAAGTLVGFVLFAALGALPLAMKVAVYSVAVLGGAWCCHVTGNALGEQDHKSISWDETVAMSLVLELVPAQWPVWIAGFLLFRLFDVVKPWPINRIHNAPPNGLWVMVDDLGAAIYAVAVVHALLWLIRQAGLSI